MGSDGTASLKCRDGLEVFAKGFAPGSGQDRLRLASDSAPRAQDSRHIKLAKETHPPNLGPSEVQRLPLSAARLRLTSAWSLQPFVKALPSRD